MGQPGAFSIRHLRGAGGATYRAAARIGSGGMADVFLATRQMPTGEIEPVALKCVRPGLIGIEQFIESLQVEARIAARLDHPNVARVYEMGCQDERPFLVLEFLLGETVDTLLRACKSQDRTPPVGAVVRIVADAARGLLHAHTLTDEAARPLRIVHRDVSPQNLLVTSKGVTKVLDFGIATAALRFEETQPGVLKGKFAYLSPERVRVQGVDHRSDLFSLGIVLWEMLTGQRLFAAGNMITTLHAVVNRPVPRVRSLRPEVSAQLDEVVARMLERRLDRRWQCAGALLEALEEAAPEGSSERDVAAFVHELVGDAVAQRRATAERVLLETIVRTPVTTDVNVHMQLASLPESDERERDAEDTRPSLASALGDYRVEPHVERALGTMLAQWDRQSGSADELHASLREIIEGPDLPETARVGMHDLALGLLTRSGASLEVRAFHAERGSDPFLALALLDECGEVALRAGDSGAAISWRRRGLELARRALLRGELDEADEAVNHFSCKLADVLIERGDAVAAHGILREAQDVATRPEQRKKIDERLFACGVVRASSFPKS